MFIANCYHSSQPSEHPSTSHWPTSQPSESPSLSSQPSVDPTPSPSNAPTSAVSCWSVWSIVHLDFSHKVQYICFYIYSPPLNQRRALLQPRPVRWVVEMFVIVYPWLYYPNQYLSYDIFVHLSFLYSPPLNQRWALQRLAQVLQPQAQALQPRPARWVVEMFMLFYIQV